MKQVNLKWKLALEERQRVADGAGGFADTWVVLGHLWGDVQSRSSSTSEVIGGTTSKVRQRIVVRGVAEGAVERPKIGQRFVYGQRVYAIDSVSEMDGSGIYLVCWTREEVLS